jgi:ERCC4-related helicase
LAEKLLLNRKRIIHKCGDKIRVYREILKEIGEEKLRYAFVYVPQGKYDPLGIENEVQLSEEDDLSFIQKLLNETKDIFPNVRCNTFTGKDNKQQRQSLLNSFAEGKLNALFAMKCLDEGVDIPRAEYGIFTSSTGNPREFIQRRGRLLRNHEGKRYSYIYDIIVIPNSICRNERFSQMERNQVKAELKRVAYFATLAQNCYTNNGAYEVLNALANSFGITWLELIEDINQ